MGLALLETSQQLYEALVSSLLDRQSLKCLDFIFVIVVGILGLVNLEDIGVCWSSIITLRLVYISSNLFLIATGRPEIILPWFLLLDLTDRNNHAI